MAQNFIGYTNQLTTGVDATVFTANTTDAVIGIRMANITAAAVTVDVWVNVAGATIRYIVKSLSIPPASSVEIVQGGAKFVLNSTDVLMATTSGTSAVDMITSVVDAISTAP
jgi:FKBP-type peptidyl-prolyl cis-trans isomerase 2|tara:strand:+ start:33 stop:368 length:336 start_codon:yes stop_codon:yes gene_type:complete